MLCLLVSELMPSASVSGAAEEALVALPAGIQAFHPGETLTYDVSWSRVFSAGTVTMAVESADLPEKREVLRFVVEGRTQGLMDKVFPVHDVVQSVFDPQLMQSLSYSLRESYGKKKRLRVTEFDHANGTAIIRLNEDPPETVDIPDPVQNGLSLIYFLRTREDLSIGRQMEIAVLDSGRIWTIEVAVLAREKIATAAGKFATVKIRTSPKDTGGIVKKREVFLWLTDDDRKVPVRMKSTLKVGAFVFELIAMKPGTHTQR
ncbi:MAG: DUF3108 domain-containing protein [Nitrospirota bacterium]